MTGVQTCALPILREDNKKLLGIRNIMKDDNRVEELTDGMTKSERDMYEDILSGNKDNFVNINEIGRASCRERV